MIITGTPRVKSAVPPLDSNNGMNAAMVVPVEAPSGPASSFTDCFRASSRRMPSSRYP